MLTIRDITYRIEGRTLFERASATLPARHRIGFVGRNGTGKSTLLRLMLGEITPESGAIEIPSRWKVGAVAQEAPGGPESLIDTVLAADTERTALLTEEQTATDPHRIAEIHTRLTDIEAHSAPARAAAILSGLGFDEAAQARPCSSYSGGWRMRVALAAVLFTAPDLLLLDEPTNYLDLEGTIWLENFLKTYPHTVLIVSHDRDLLNRCVQSILHLSHQRLKLYAGGYDTFEDTRLARLNQQLAMAKKQEAQVAHMQAFVDRFRYKASKARQAQSRLKAIEKMKPIAAELESDVVPLHFPNPDPLSPPIITMEGAEAGYDGTPILRRLTLRIDNDDRIALLGANGNGKSTFAKLIAQRLKPLSGRVRRSPTLRIGYFAQHQLDELNEKRAPYDYFEELYPDDTEAKRRARLGAVGFSAQKSDTAIGKLSGGEKARLLLALATQNKPHLLILDEPTNHLDVDSRESLVHAINAYEGAVILISHDRHLIETCADRLWLVGGGKVAPFDGDLEDYKAVLLGRDRSAPRKPAAPDRKAEARKASAGRRAGLAPLKRDAERWEKVVATCAEKLSEVEARLADPELYTAPPDKLTRLNKLRADWEQKKYEAEERWLAALEAYETAQAEAQDA